MPRETATAAGSNVVGHVRFALSIAIAVVMAIAGSLGSLGSTRAMQETDADTSAGVRIVHGIANAGPLDVYIDGAIALIGIVFADASGDLIVPAGDREFAVVPTGSAPDAAVAEGTIDLRGGTRYYATLFGTLETPSVGLFAVDERPLDAGRARFRVISGVPDAGEIVPFFAGGDALSEPLAFGDASRYAAIEAGVYDLDMLDAVSGVSLLTLPQTPLAEGTTTDVILVGQINDASLQALIASTDVAVARVLGRTAQILSGTCVEPGDVAAELGVVQVGQGETVGVAGTAPVEQGFGLAAIPFSTLIASPYTVTVSADDGANGAAIACGAIGGQLTDTGALVIALEANGADAAAGVAVLAPGLEDPETTGVSIFLPAGVSPAPSAATPAAATG